MGEVSGKSERILHVAFDGDPFFLSCGRGVTIVRMCTSVRNRKPSPVRFGPARVDLGPILESLKTIMESCLLCDQLQSKGGLEPS